MSECVCFKEHGVGKVRVDPDCSIHGDGANDLTHQEAYALVAGEMYVPGEDGYQAPDDVIAGLEPEVVAQARKYAEFQNLPWPPIASGMIMTIHSETT